MKVPYYGAPNQPYNPAQLNSESQRWFETVDKDRSQKINRAELQAALVNGQGKHFSDAACNLMIAMFDKNKTGLIDADAFEQLYAYINQWLAVFRTYDRDQSGSIDESELTLGN